MNSTVVILNHSIDKGFRKTAYTLNHLAKIWELKNLKVKIACGINQQVQGDVVFNHVDLTITPPEYVEYMQQYSILINGGIMDISKRVYLNDLLHRGDNYQGPVVVKTDANYGGVMDARLSPIEDYGVQKEKNWKTIKVLNSSKYPIFRSMQSVPPGVWLNKNLIVQKFLPERDEHSNFILRCWSFLGNREFQVLATSPSPIVKGTTIVRRKILDEPVPEELQEIRRKLHIDFGRFDYAMPGGKVRLFDVNRTTVTSPKARQLYEKQLIDLADGIYDFI